MAPLPNILTLLRLHRSTNGLTDEELDLIASRASVITFEADTPLHSQENPFIDLLLIISGAARLWIPGVDDVPHIVQTELVAATNSVSSDFFMRIKVLLMSTRPRT